MKPDNTIMYVQINGHAITEVMACILFIKIHARPLQRSCKILASNNPHKFRKQTACKPMHLINIYYNIALNNNTFFTNFKPR